MSDVPVVGGVGAAGGVSAAGAGVGPVSAGGAARVCRAPLLLSLVHTSAVLVAGVSLAVTLWTGLEERGVAVAFGVLIG
ncbi:MAG: hypothetical protein HOV92_33210, partial [Streptomyces sp.]|nr:hypothetical protein [Streptomyces sp.]